jgi:hypothetical protein
VTGDLSSSCIYICVCVCACVRVRACVRACVCVCVDLCNMRDHSNFSTVKSQMILNRAKVEVKTDD